MTGTQLQLERVAAALYQGNAGLAIVEMETYLAAYPQQQTTDRLNGIKTEYELMVDYWRRALMTRSWISSTSISCSVCMCFMPMWHPTLIYILFLL